MKYQKLFTILLFLFLHFIQCIGQDAFFTTFHNKRSFYNPAAVGLNNSLAFRTTYKSQWSTLGLPTYESILIEIEDAMPCSILDWGLCILKDTEGAGRFTTYQAGVKLAISLSDINPSQTRQHNIRGGFNWSFGKHTIDYSKLTFSDNIDPKDGFVNPTSFLVPNDGNSPIFFNPSVGIILQSLWHRTSAQSISTNFGVSISNAFSLGGENFGHSSSVLGLAEVNNKFRYSAFAELNLLPRVKRNFISNISPMFFYQIQGGIHYWELGSGINITPNFEVGIYTHNSKLILDDANTSWLSATTSIMIKSTGYSRIALDLTYSTNYKGLQNQVGPIFEIGITMHFARSIGCGLFGNTDAVFYSEGQKCPIMKISRAKRKMYENVWYKN